MTVKKYIFKFGFIFKIFFFLYATNFFYVWKFEIDNEDINMYLLHVTPDLLKPNNETSQHFSVFEACWLIINGYGWMTGLVMCEGMNSEACWCMARVQYILKHLYIAVTYRMTTYVTVLQSEWWMYILQIRFITYTCTCL